MYKGIEWREGEGRGVDVLERGRLELWPVLYCIGLIRRNYVGAIDESNDVVTEWMEWCGGCDGFVMFVTCVVRMTH